MVRCIAIDDEPLALEIIEDYIARFSGLELVAKITDSTEALDTIRRHDIDIVFLDVEMPGTSGIEIARALETEPRPYAVILTTAYPQYALDGFELNVTDYLLKPIPFERFERAVQKASSGLRSGKATEHVAPDRSGADYIFVKSDQRVKKIDLESICFVEGMKDYVSIHTDGERVVTLQLMRKMEELLPPDRFMRVHRSYIVALHKITEIDRYRVQIGDHEIPIGETYREAFLKKSLERRI